MRKVIVVSKIEKRAEDIWKLIMDLENFVKSVKFVKKATILKSVKEGMEFYDVTTILWFPIRIKHKILTIKKNEKFVMEAYFPFKNGKMLQTIALKDMGNYSKIKVDIEFNINFPFFDIILGPILEMRLKQMIMETIKNIENQMQE